jgi:hypothetical protein
MSAKQKSKQIKARRMWVYDAGASMVVYHMKKGGCSAPVAVLDISDPEALVEQASGVLFKCRQGFTGEAYAARAVLTSLGILPVKKGRK